MSWEDAQAYAKWLSDKTKQPYRLLSESEWEYSARGRTAPGTYPRYFFGDSEKEFCAYGNGADETKKKQVPGASGWTTLPCASGYLYTSPVGSFKPNLFGLYDMHGNVWQWVQDCYYDSYNGAPSDGSAWTSGACSYRVVRGGSWLSLPQYLRPASRSGNSTGIRSDTLGFRVGRTLTP